MLALLAKFLPALNGAVGIGAVLALVSWLADNSTRNVCFGYDQIAVIAAVFWGMLELNHRAPPPNA